MSQPRRMPPGAADAAPTKVKVDGKEYDVSTLVKDHEDKQKWESAYKQRDQRLAEERKEVSRILEKAIDKSEAKSPPREPERTATPSVNLTEELKSLPDSAEDPEGYRRGMEKILESSTKAAVDRARANMEAENSKLRGEISKDRAERATERSRAIVEANIDLLETTLREQFPDGEGGTVLTDDEKTEVRNELAAIYSEKYGEIVTLPNNKTIIKYNKSAVQKALRNVDSVYERMVAEKTATVREESLRGRRRGFEATPDPDTTSRPRPGPKASPREQVEWLRTQDEDTVREVYSSLSKDDRNRLLRAARGLD